MGLKPYIALAAALWLAACASSGDKRPRPDSPRAGGPAMSKKAPKSAMPLRRDYTPVPGRLSLPDRTAFLQKDPRWARHTLGGSGDTLERDGCLVTATAMALGNLGFDTNPADLNARLKAEDSYTSRGWLIWSGIDKVTDGRATAQFHTQVSAEIIDQCMLDGYYPLARFVLPNGRSHWAVILKRDRQGYHMRDPLHPSKSPLIFPRGADAFKAVRCVGLADG